jgi:hypothetical protein
MSVRAGIGCARPAAGRIAAVTAVLALLASLAGFSARPTAAGLVSGDSIPETTVLPANVDVLPGDKADTGTFVLTVPIRLQAGQSRRISDQLTVTVPRDAVVWHAGNTVKIDAGSGFEFRSATNANVIVRSTRPTTTVPDVTGVDQGSVAGHLAGAGLTLGTVTRVANPVAAGHVIAQNSPPAPSSRPDHPWT